MSIASTLLTGRLLGPHSDHKVFLVGISGGDFWWGFLVGISGGDFWWGFPANLSPQRMLSDVPERYWMVGRVATTFRS
jgi:hypothetical protein